MLRILPWIVSLAVSVYLVNQVRKPTRWTGQLFARIMNGSHSRLTDWGLTHVHIGKAFTILDVGCGGGRTIQKLAAATDGKVYGVDYAAGSVATARSTNAAEIRAGRVDVQRASVSALPFPDAAFDLVTAVETQYYWPDLANDMREILRVLKPDGTLLVVAETHKGSKYDWAEKWVMKALRSTRLSVEDQRKLFETAGFSEVQVSLEPGHSWLCATGRK